MINNCESGELGGTVKVYDKVFYIEEFVHNNIRVWKSIESNYWVI